MMVPTLIFGLIVGCGMLLFRIGLASYFDLYENRLLTVDGGRSIEVGVEVVFVGGRPC